MKDLDPVIDEYDWFRPVQSTLSSGDYYLEPLTNNKVKFKSDLASLASSYDTYYEELNKEFYSLNKSYSSPQNSKLKQRTFKMMTSYDKDEFLYTYLDNQADNELVDSLKSSTLKAVHVFQKPYYQEAIRGQPVQVPSWRMKEKVNC